MTLCDKGGGGKNIEKSVASYMDNPLVLKS